MDHYIVTDLLHYCNVRLPGYFYIGPRPIPYYDLTFVLEGSVTYVVDDKAYVIHKNDAIFIKPGMKRERLKTDKQVRHVSFNFEAADVFNLSLPVYMPNSFSADMKKLIQYFPCSHIPQDNFSKQKAVNLLNIILLELLEKNTSKSQNTHIKRIMEIVDERLTEKLTLQDISTELNLSKEYTSYIFRKETGKTLTDYIHEQKMRMAKDFITHGEMTLTEISQALGFDNYNYFSRLFKKQFDCTPKDMQKTL